MRNALVLTLNTCADIQREDVLRNFGIRKQRWKMVACVLCPHGKLQCNVRNRQGNGWATDYNESSLYYWAEQAKKIIFSFEREMWLQKSVEKYHSLACRPSCATETEVFVIQI